MKKISFLFLILLGIQVAKSQSKLTITPEEAISKITAILHVENVNRAEIFKTLYPKDNKLQIGNLKEIVAKNKKGNYQSIGYIINYLPCTAQENGKLAPVGLIYYGYLLFNDGCFHFGLFIVADDGESLFIDSNDPDGINGCCHADICMSEEEFDSYCRTSN
jgi:hypothetical protein